MAIDPRIPMMGEATPFQSPFETQRNALALRQAQTEMAGAETKRALDMFRMGRQVLASAHDEGSYQRGREALRRAGIPVDDMPPNYDPEYVRSEGMALLDAEERYKQQLFQDGGDIFGVSPYTGQVNMLRQGPPPAPAALTPYQAEQLRLQQERLDLERQRGAGGGDRGMSEAERQRIELERRRVELAEKEAARRAEKSTGTTGTAGTPRTSEQERNTAYNAGRLLTAAREIASATSRAPNVQTPGLAESAAASIPLIGGSLANVVRNEDRQIVNAAQADMIDALLYLATGAAYNKEQLAAQREALLPRFTDKPGTIEAKRRSLMDKIEQAKVRSGNAWTPEMDAALQSLMGGAPKAMRPEDQQALNWANANPNDPRSAQIKQRLGVK